MQGHFDFFALLIFWAIFGLIFTIGLTQLAIRLESPDSGEEH